MFYNSNISATLGKLYIALKTVRYLGQATQSVNDKQVEVESLLNQIYALAVQLIDAQSETEAAQILAQQDVLIMEYLQKQDEYEQLATNFSVALQQQATAQLTIINGTTTTTSWEQNLKLVLQYQLGVLSSGQSLSQTQTNTLQAIADQCRYEGGFGVLLARKMLPVQQYDENILCSGRNSDSGKKQADKLLIYPNPAGNFILLTLPKQTDAGTVLMFDALGQLVRNYKSSGLETRLDISDVRNGTYFLKITIEGKPSVIKKVVVLR